jgi:alpha-galactosidase
MTVICIAEAICHSLVDAIVSSGLRDAGYRVFIVDEPCFLGRDTNGNLVTNHTSWPSGFAAFGDYLHTRNMTFGIYTDRKRNTITQMNFLELLPR